MSAGANRVRLAVLVRGALFMRSAAADTPTPATGGHAPRGGRKNLPWALSLVVAMSALTGACTSGSADTARIAQTTASGASAAASQAPQQAVNKDELRGVCTFLSQVNQAADASSSPAQGLLALKRIQTQIHQVSAAAPDTAAADLQVLSEAVDQAVKQNKLDPLATDAVASAGAKLVQMCT